MAKTTFTIDAEKVLNILELYSFDDVGRVLEGLCRFELYGEYVPFSDKGLQMAFNMLTIDIKRNDAKYAEKSARNKSDYQKRKDSENSATENAENNSANSERDRKGKERIGKERIGKDINNNSKENIYVYNMDSAESDVTKSSSSPFKKPTLDEVKSYIKEKNYSVDAETFWNFYESKGWMIGKNKMKSWKSALVTWTKSKNNHIPYQKTRISDINEREYTKGQIDMDLNDPTAMF